MIKQIPPWRNSVAIVTGAASGIGRALAEELALRGAEVVLADRQLAVAADVADGIRARGGRATAFQVDVRDFAAVRYCVDATVERMGHIDYLFNNAGINVFGDVLSYKASDWDDVFDVNLRGVAYGVQAAYPHMVARGCGHIVNTASAAGLLPSPDIPAYAASKHAVIALSRALRLEGQFYGVRVSALCPGLTRTAMLIGGKFGRMNTKGVSQEFWERLQPMDPSELARRTLDAVERNKAIIIIPKGWKWSALWLLDRLAPALSMKLWGKNLERTFRALGRHPGEREGRRGKIERHCP